MTTRDICIKLTAELDKGITSEIQVVYLLAGIRKLIERDTRGEQFPALKFHCDWALHSRMDRAAAQLILTQFDAAHVLMRKDVELHDPPRPLQFEINRVIQMKSFERELTEFLRAYSLPPLTQHRWDGWVHFLRLYARVVEDIPLMVAGASMKRASRGTRGVGPQHVSRVTVNLEEARETIKHEHGEELVFRVTWTIYDKNGPSGSIDVYHSFSLRPRT